MRPGLLPDASVPACYAQNTILYVRSGSEIHAKLLERFRPVTGRVRFRVRNLAHPFLGTMLNGLPARVLEWVYPYYTAAWYRFVQPRSRPG